MVKEYLKNQAGFTLVELIVAIAIMGIVMSGVLHLFGTTLYLNEQTKKNTAMQMQARKVLSYITDDVKYGHTVDKATTSALGKSTTTITIYNTSGTAMVVYTYADNKLQRGTEYITDNTIEVTQFEPVIAADKQSMQITLGVVTKKKDWKTNQPLTHKVTTAVHTLPTTS